MSSSTIACTDVSGLAWLCCLESRRQNTQATRHRERGKSDTVAFKIVTSEENLVVRLCEDFFWLCEKLALSYPGVVLPSPPCAGGISFPSQRSGEMGAYLERCRKAADKFVRRIASRREIVGNECVVAFLYAPDQVFERAKPRLEAEASQGVSVKLRRESWAAFAKPGSNVGWLERLTNLVDIPGGKPRTAAQTGEDIDEALGKLAVLEETPQPTQQQQQQQRRQTSTRDMLAAAEAEMERQLREQAAQTESSFAHRVLEAAADREALQEERCELAAKRCSALAKTLERRSATLAAGGAALKDLSRADADATAAAVLRRLGDRLLDEEQGADDEARLRFGSALAVSVDEARLSTRACSAALRQRAAVAAAVGDANGRAARAKTKHARCEAALAAARDKRVAAVAQVRRDAENARRVSDAFVREDEERPVVEARPALGASHAVRAVPVAYETDSPLALALRRTAEGRPTARNRALEALETACAPVRRLPETLDCSPPVARAAETLTCGAVLRSQSSSSSATGRLGARVDDLEQALAAAETQAAEARAEAAAANDAQTVAEAALLDATKRVASELRRERASRAADLAADLKTLAHHVLARAKRERAAWGALHEALEPPRQPMHHPAHVPAFDTPPRFAPSGRGGRPSSSSQLTSRQQAEADWFELLADPVDTVVK